ncbi:hypothetical protein Hdeb2414_s0024g00647101 [Helianthus debilis subsp. tardiflorus]
MVIVNSLFIITYHIYIHNFEIYGYKYKLQISKNFFLYKIQYCIRKFTIFINNYEFESISAFNSSPCWDLKSCFFIKE